MTAIVARRTALSVALSLVLLPFLSAFPATAATTVKVGAYEFPPYVTEGGAGVTQGLLDLLNAAQNDLRFELVLTSPQRRYEDLEQGRFDAIAFESVAWGWKERPVDATRVFLQDAEVFVAKAGPGVDQSIFDSLDGKTILGRLGYHYAFAGYNSDPKTLESVYRTRVTVTHEGNVRNVIAGRATFAIVTRSFLNQFLKGEPDLAKRILVSGRTDQIYQHTILVRRGGPVTAAALDALLDRLEADGRLGALWARSGIAP
ncbi:substrate-binding periplasmic protein [Azospirillum doebereinerae]|uniref:Transporter substrate-binding domain-containing protein n=1 Tax=Azospirillum doebereinerae TaxID=92933 RepID=A0A3S0WVZ5_9PROT|nr:transporter substrate-binding domain-containing protein [Azospirillum doebereinerae]MCG5243264.1 transporter substrate-binding domain-containing protein [Azospirillum doebereinerae]RUQ72904.1 transporter substrate-binding domain-containing protein [Azospirillum doebereinerae]